MRDCTDIAITVGAVKRVLLIPGVAPKKLPGQLHENALGGGKYAFYGDPRIVDSVFASHQVVAYQRPIYPRQQVIVLRVYLPESSAEFTYFCNRSEERRV